MKGPRAKGSTINMAIAAFRDILGPELFQSQVATLSAEAQRPLVAPPTFAEWVPQPLCSEFYDYAFRLFGGSAITMHRAGVLAAKAGLKSSYQIFLRALSPQRTIRNWPTIWKVITAEWGDAKVSRLDEGVVEIVMEHFPQNSTAVWHFISGLLLGVVEASGGKNGNCRIIGGGGSMQQCTFEVSWSGV